MEKKIDIDARIDEINNILPQKKEMKTITGETFELPPVTLGMELRIARKLLELLKSGGVTKGDIAKQNLYQILINAFCGDAGEEIILDVFAIITGKPPEWLLENVDLESMLECLLPFFVQRIKALTRAIGEKDMPS